MGTTVCDRAAGGSVECGGGQSGSWRAGCGRSSAGPTLGRVPDAARSRDAMRSPRARPRPSAARPPSVVLTCGLATLDVVQTVDHVPAPDEKLVATDLVVAAGGPAATAAVTCSTLGIPARLLSRIGDGPLASIVAADLREAGVDVVDVGGPGLSPPVSTVLVTRGTGERAVVSVNATASGARQLDGSGTDLLAGLLAGAVVVLVDGHHLDLALGCARAARERGIPVVLDGGSWKPGLEALLPLVDVAVLSADFAVPGARDPLAAVRRAGPRVVAQSHGPGPIRVLTYEGITTVEVPAVEVVDTLGAGDVLHGALVAWLAAAHDAEATPAAHARLGRRRRA